MLVKFTQYCISSFSKQGRSLISLTRPLHASLGSRLLWPDA